MKFLIVLLLQSTPPPPPNYQHFRPRPITNTLDPSSSCEKQSC